jgi:hypothetical protein
MTCRLEHVTIDWSHDVDGSGGREREGPEVSEIVVVPVPIERVRELTTHDVHWEGPELRLGIHVETAAEDAPIRDEARRRTALTTTASGTIG